jgi:hypothetical protein
MISHCPLPLPASPPHASFFTPVPFPEYMPNLDPAPEALASKVGVTLRRSSGSCIVCYFLGRCHPIQVILTHERGGQWHEVDLHYCEPERCPWRLIYPTSDFSSFSSELTASLRCSNSGGGGWWVCRSCAEPYMFLDGHETCTYGPNLSALAFMLWNDVPTRNHVFTYITSFLSIELPDFQSRQAYAHWLGCPVSVFPSFNYLHVVVVAYDNLRSAILLPRLVLSISWLPFFILFS